MYAVFSVDGHACECRDLVGIFETRDGARRAAELVEALIHCCHLRYLPGIPWRGEVVVEPVVPGEYTVPEFARHVMEAISTSEVDHNRILATYHT